MKDVRSADYGLRVEDVGNTDYGFMIQGSGLLIRDQWFTAQNLWYRV
jgi:hypothetical protein